MINEIFKINFPFAYEYFSTLLELAKKEGRKFPQSLIFEGADTIGQYFFAYELARILNCKNLGQSDCDCLNCKWVRSFSHPHVLNVSQIHFKPDDDLSKTVISVNQALAIEKNLSLTCDGYRFFIFFSSSEDESHNERLSDFAALGYDNINYSISPLRRETFSPATPNALLKSVEEPPKNTTFVFLTKSKEDILSTIVSRSLVFKLSGERKKEDYSLILNTFSNYPDIDYIQAFDISNELQRIIKENAISIEDILNQFLEYLKELLKSNLDNLALISKIQKDIKLTNHAIKSYRASMSDKIILDTLFLSIARGY